MFYSIFTLQLQCKNQDKNRSKNKKGEDCLTLSLMDDKSLTISNTYIANFEIISYINPQKGDEYFSGDTIKVFFRTSKFDLNQRQDIDNMSMAEKSLKFKEFYYLLFPFHIQKEKDSNMLIVNKDDFPKDTYEIKKVPIQKGHESIYIKNIINKLETEILEKNSKSNKNIEIITKHLIYYENYLLNLDESFYDPNYPKYIPIRSRQTLLDNYKILSIISTILHIFNSSALLNNKNKIQENDMISENNKVNTNYNNEDTSRELIKNLLRKILSFLTYLCFQNKEIQEKIFDKTFKDFFQVNIMDNNTIVLFTVFKTFKENHSIQEKLFECRFCFNYSIKQKRYE